MVVSLATEDTYSKLEVEHHPARSTVTGVKLVSVKVLLWRCAPGSEGVGMIDNRHLLPVAHCQEHCVGDLYSLSSHPMGGTMEDTSTVASGKTCFNFLLSCLHMLSVTTANLHVLTPMRITTRLTSLFLGMLASQWLTSMMDRPETLMFWL